MTIPKRIRDELDLDEGTEIEFVLEEDGGITVQPKKSAMEQLEDVQQKLSHHTPDIAEMRLGSKSGWSSLDANKGHT